MFNVNDVVCYQNYGICKIVEKKKLRLLNNEPKEYYLMRPIFDANESTMVKIPTDTKNIIRQVMSEVEAVEFVKNLSKVEVVWNDNIKEREYEFKQLINSWKIEKWAIVIKSVYESRNANQNTTRPRSIPIIDTKYFNRAELLLNQELAYALHMDVKEVPDYIAKVLAETTS